LLILLKNAHVSKLVALSVEKHHMALTAEVQLEYVGFMAPLAKKVPDPCSSAILGIERFTNAYARQVDEQMMALIQSRSLELHYQNY